MSVGMIVALAVGMAMGAALCGVAILALMDIWYVGVLREDRSDPEQPMYFMEISKGRAGRLGHAKRVMLNVQRENYLEEK